MTITVNLDVNALFDVCPDLRSVSLARVHSINDVLDAVREAKAQSVQLVPSRRLYRPDFNPVSGYRSKMEWIGFRSRLQEERGG